MFVESDSNLSQAKVPENIQLDNEDKLLESVGQRAQLNEESVGKMPTLREKIPNTMRSSKVNESQRNDSFNNLQAGLNGQSNRNDLPPPIKQNSLAKLLRNRNVWLLILLIGLAIKVSHYYITSKGTYEGSIEDGKRHGVGTFVYSDWSKYSGWWKFDKKHGSGVLTWPNGTSYDGDWEDDMMHGQGKFNYSDKIYTGIFANDKRNGWGRLEWTSGEIYEGEFNNDMRHGQGIYGYLKGEYAGSWFDDKYHGLGTETYFINKTDSDRYFGSWVKGKREGEGTFVSKGRTYKGSWANDTENGFGIETWDDGLIYQGNWVNGLKEGFGFMSLKNGSSLKGKWDKNVMKGLCSITWPNRDLYEGPAWPSGSDYVEQCPNNKCSLDGTIFFSNRRVYNGSIEFTWPGQRIGNDLPYITLNGKGTMNYPDKRKFKGIWVNNEVRGLGILMFPNGDQYEGQFIRENFNGQGKMTYGDGRSYVGAWVNGYYNGLGTLTFNNGDVYSGQFEHGQLTGSATMTYANGRKVSGTWKDAKLVSYN